MKNLLSMIEYSVIPRIKIISIVAGITMIMFLISMSFTVFIIIDMFIHRDIVEMKDGLIPSISGIVTLGLLYLFELMQPWKTKTNKGQKC